MLKNKITLHDKELFEKYTYTQNMEASGLSFTSLFMWKDLNKFTYEVINDFLCICGINYLQMDYLEHFAFPPLSTKECDPNKLSETLDVLRQKFENRNCEFKIKLVPEEMIESFQRAKPHELDFISDRDNADYVYLSENLIELKGRKYHSKKNHLNFFYKNIPFEYVSLTPDLISDCIALTKELVENREYTTLEQTLIELEQQAVEQALNNMDALGCKGGAILINGQVEAFTLGCKINPNMFVVHIEKANTKIRGIYPAINQQFSKHSCTDVEYINREEDMGLANLRKSKLSYKPDKMIEKYDVIFKK
ncbi:DUF2156 domain-containing protein [Lutibacter sp. B2]|nr:DUF2156 domain-containing protein [Lutibacter sp. B2]